ncbi:MAG TPA: carboxymuconolactone decarboxylase family protein, partial [Mycobacteriales bacterium]|nr:carboxymuconolactone decarboxylase family protein [Mycobacteriales bacterium]
ALRDGQQPDLEDPDEAIALSTVRALLDRGDLSDEEYQAARGQLGERVLFELITLVGFYALIALQLRVYRVPLPPG